MDTVRHAESIGFKLVHAVTEYDRKQEGRRGYNMYALPQYLQAAHNVTDEIIAGKTVRAAVVSNFCGRLLDVCLKAIGETKSTDAEQRM